jgi:hypothetical protein
MGRKSSAPATLRNDDLRRKRRNRCRLADNSINHHGFPANDPNFGKRADLPREGLVGAPAMAVHGRANALKFFFRFRQHKGHCRTFCWPGPVANDPEPTPLDRNSQCGLLQQYLELMSEPCGSRNTLTFIAYSLDGSRGAMRRAGYAVDSASRLSRACGAVAAAIAGDGARPRRVLREFSNQVVV